MSQSSNNYNRPPPRKVEGGVATARVSDDEGDDILRMILSELRRIRRTLAHMDGYENEVTESDVEIAG